MTATLDHEVAALRRANAELQRRLDEHTVELKARTAERDEAQAQQTRAPDPKQVAPGVPEVRVAEVFPSLSGDDQHGSYPFPS